MSAAGQCERRAEDYYITPAWMVDEFLELYLVDYSAPWTNVLDPCAGGCKNFGMPYPRALAERRLFNVTTVDIRPDSHAEITANYLEWHPGKLFDAIITNPPFYCSVEITEKALEDVVIGGHVIMLQRLNWIGTTKRQEFWKKAPLKHVYAHHKRAKFDPDKPNQTDSIEYAHFVFERGYSGETKFSII